MKAFANPSHDWSEIQGILLRQGQKLDDAYILEQTAILAPAMPEEPILQQLKELLDR